MLNLVDIILVAVAVCGLILAAIYTRSVKGSIVAGLTALALGLNAFPWERVNLPSGSAVGMLMVFCVAAFAYAWQEKNNLSQVINPYTKMLFGILVVVVIWLAFTDYKYQGSSKVVIFFCRGVLPACAILALGPLTRRDYNIILAGMLFCSIFLSLRWGVSDTAQWVRTAYADEASPIAASRTIGMGVVVAASIFLFTKRFSKEFVLFGILGVSLGFALLWPGSRGPILALLFALGGVVILGYLSPRYHSGKLMTRSIAAIALIVVLTGSFWALGERFGFRGVERVFGFFSDIQSDELLQETRVDLLRMAWSGFIGTFGIGLGTGGFSVFSYVPGEARYPHNIFAEFATEQGIVGLIMISILSWLMLKRMRFLFWQPRFDIIEPVLCAFWIFTFFNSLLSSNIGTNFQFWFAGALLFVNRSAVREIRPLTGASRKERSAMSSQSMIKGFAISPRI